MTKNLWEIYIEFPDCRSSYYDTNLSIDKLFGKEASEAKEECMNFIVNEFSKGSKKEVLNIFLDDRRKSNLLESIRPTHMVGLYLLGMSLAKTFSFDLKKSLGDIISNIDEWYDLKYTWYITCLYHDITSCEEKNISETDSRMLQFQKEYSIFEHFLVNGKKFKRDNSEETLIKKYYNYRLNKGRSDHGIVAGMQLFDSLCANFSEKTAGKEFCHNQIYLEGLSWRKEHLDHFAYIVDAIIWHNVWYAYTPEKIAEYKKDGLEELVIERNGKDNRIAFSNNPLRFMLCLLDTIEPIKRFNYTPAEKVLKGISIIGTEKSDDTHQHSIIISWKEYMEVESNFYLWMKGILELKYWMNVNMGVCSCMEDGCQLTISW